jgi:uncharacterized membrane protein HdeD (DUF308 family)
VNEAIGFVGALQNRGESGWWLVVLLALFSIAAGVIAVFYPAVTALVLVFVIGFNAMFAGVLLISMVRCSPSTAIPNPLERGPLSCAVT